MPALLTTMSSRPKSLDDAGERLVDLRALGNVGRIGTRLDAGLRQLLGGHPRRVGVDLEHGDRGPGLGELLRDAATETRA